jgi:DNA mismatch endonuclease (patch repair protein)
MVTDAERTVESQYPPARTKLLVPELPATHVPRSRLVRHLNDSVTGFAITLVAGFAGSGKTVLLAEFARSRSMGSVAWLSCDVTDADPVHFWTALVGAFRTFDPAIGADALDLLGVDGQLGRDAIASLVNELLDLDGTRLLVLDDLHLVTRAALPSLGEFLERLPLSVRVVISARSDPRLPFHRWRASGRLGELRAAELRMAPSEVAQFVGAVGVNISPEDAAVLADRTEGWAAGVQLLGGSWATTPGIRRRMQLQREHDTGPELRLRRELHRRGLRYRLHLPVVPGTRRRRVDIVFPRSKVAVFVDGCFWHGCPEHGQRQHDLNGWYWPTKITGNRARDVDTDRRLDNYGWTVVRVWEHEPVAEAADRVEATVRSRSRG